MFIVADRENVCHSRPSFRSVLLAYSDICSHTGRILRDTMFSLHQNSLSNGNNDCNEQLYIQPFHLLLDEREIQERFQICISMFREQRA